MATPLGNIRNSYITADDADAYFATRLHTDAWDNSSSIDRDKSLIMATRAIDRLQFAGVKTSEYIARLSNMNSIAIGWGIEILPSVQVPDPQPLEFPRNGDSNVPQEILMATCECALAFLDGVDIEAELSQLNVTSVKIADVHTTYDRQLRYDHLRAGIPSVIAWTLLSPFLNDPYSIRLCRA